MKRDPSLAPFSRDHHVALVVAQRLKWPAEGNVEQARNTFLDYWHRDGRRHFREEEELLLPTFAAFADPDIPVVARVLVDHVRIRQQASAVMSGPPNAADLNALGALLEDHVRREERELFPLIEQTVSDGELERLEAFLDH